MGKRGKELGRMRKGRKVKSNVGGAWKGTARNQQCTYGKYLRKHVEGKNAFPA